MNYKRITLIIVLFIIVIYSVNKINQKKFVFGSDYLVVNGKYGKGCTISGKIVSIKRNTPIAGCPITFTSSSGDVSAISDAEGKYNIDIGELEISRISISNIDLKKNFSTAKGLNIDFFIDM